MRLVDVAKAGQGRVSQGLYLDSRPLELKDGELKVNLLFNRASPWADVHSRIPYEGRVDVEVKEGCDLSIRIPEWVKPSEVNVQVASSPNSKGPVSKGPNSKGPDSKGQPRKVSFAGRYALCGTVQAKDIVTLTLPLSCWCVQIREG